MKKERNKQVVLVWVLVSVGIVAFLSANAHLVYVAVTSEPDCVYVKSETHGVEKTYKPAKPSC
ncbi:hypothetical protein [Sneathiella sp.]|uniref:hypothetical protein n=1 Tax=Sneathiella sp. TaxID=1964365 RepID=UPI00356357E9